MKHKPSTLAERQKPYVFKKPVKAGEVKPQWDQREVNKYAERGGRL